MTVHNSQRACERKAAFRSEEKAKMALRAMVLNQTAKPGLHVYFCERCTKRLGRPAYHLGTPARWCR